MPFTKIVPADLQGKGVIGQPPVPGLSVNEMQESVEQIVREVAIPAVNRLVDELEATSASGNIGMSVPSGMAPETPKTVQGVVQSHVENSENPHGVTAAQVGAYTKAETDQAIDEKVQAIGAADMSKAEFATNGEYGVVDKAKAAETAESATESDDGVKVYTHSKSGTVHEFTGSGANGRALLTADVEAGDTFTVNGSPVDAYLGPDPAADAMAGSEWNGKWVSFVFDGTTINFKGGGGLSAADKAKLIPANIRDGVTFFAGTPKQVVGALTPAPSIMVAVGYQKSASTERISGIVNASDFSVSGGSWSDWAEDWVGADFGEYFAAIPYSDDFIFTAQFDGEVSVDIYLATSLNVAVSLSVNKNGSPIISDSLQSAGEPPTNFAFKRSSATASVAVGDEIQLGMNGVQWPGNCIIINRM